jgi:hypothetical protein
MSRIVICRQWTPLHCSYKETEEKKNLHWNTVRIQTRISAKNEAAAVLSLSYWLNCLFQASKNWQSSTVFKWRGKVLWFAYRKLWNILEESCVVLGCYEVCSGKSLFWPLKMEPIGCSETSVRIYHYTLRNNPEDRRSHLHRNRSLKSRMQYIVRIAPSTQERHSLLRQYTLAPLWLRMDVHLPFGYLRGEAWSISL